MTTDIITFTQAEEQLAANLDGYQRRPQQQALAGAIEEALANETALIAQAGCGTGKSFATSIPAILSGKRTVVSTATKALQDQVALKDLPFLQEHLGVPFTYALLKGRSNYLCLSALNDPEAESVTAISSIRARCGEDDFHGERDDLGVEVADRDWWKLTVSSEECPGKKQCPFGDECYAEAAKSRAKDADVVVVNHALLLTDLKVRMVTAGDASMLGEYEALIVDEAHELEEYAVNTFSERITQPGINALVGEVRNWILHYQLDTGVIDLGDQVLAATSALWEILEPGRLRPATILENENEWADLAIALRSFFEGICKVDLGEVAPHDYKEARGKKERVMGRTGRLSQSVADMIVAGADELVRWVEDEKNERRPDDVRRVLKSAPIDVSGILGPNLFEIVPSVLVSATLAVDGKMDYIANRLGVANYASLDVGTPFDFETQARVYIPRTLPEPSGATRSAWEALAPQEMYELVCASQGRALLLFTSKKAMVSAYELIADRLTDALNVTCYRQGEAPNKILAERFKADEHSVLFATRSFFTGVDFPGQTLELVVMDKLPFPVPTEPLVEARTELIEHRGGNAFAEYTIPVMALVLAQGAGRLIRTVTDTGVIAVLDSRILKKGYGRKILRSLPDAPVIEAFAEVEDFFGEIEAMRSLNEEAVDA